MFAILYPLENKMHRKYITFMLNEDCGSFIYLGDARNSNSKKAAPHNPKGCCFQQQTIAQNTRVWVR